MRLSATAFVSGNEQSARVRNQVKSPTPLSGRAAIPLARMGHVEFEAA